MAQGMTDELTRADEAFAGNRLLATFSREARALVEPFGTLVDLDPGEMILKRGEDVHSSLFMVGPTMVTVSNGRTQRLAFRRR